MRGPALFLSWVWSEQAEVVIRAYRVEERKADCSSLSHLPGIAVLLYFFSLWDVRDQFWDLILAEARLKQDGSFSLSFRMKWKDWGLDCWRWGLAFELLRWLDTERPIITLTNNIVNLYFPELASLTSLLMAVTHRQPPGQPGTRD